MWKVENGIEISRGFNNSSFLTPNSYLIERVKNGFRK